MSQLSHAQFPLRRHPDLLVDHRRVRSAAVDEPRGANVESRDRLRWPASSRNGGRDQIGTVADIKSEPPAGLRRNSHGAVASAIFTYEAVETARLNFVATTRAWLAIGEQFQPLTLVWGDGDALVNVDVS